MAKILIFDKKKLLILVHFSLLIKISIIGHFDFLTVKYWIYIWRIFDRFFIGCDQFLANFSPILTNFWPGLTGFWPIFYQFLTYFAQILNNFWPLFWPILTRFWPIFDHFFTQFLTNFLPNFDQFFCLISTKFMINIFDPESVKYNFYSLFKTSIFWTRSAKTICKYFVIFLQNFSKTYRFFFRHL